MNEQTELLITLWEEITKLRKELFHLKYSYALADMEHAGISEEHPSAEN